MVMPKAMMTPRAGAGAEEASSDDDSIKRLSGLYGSGVGPVCSSANALLRQTASGFVDDAVKISVNY